MKLSGEVSKEEFRRADRQRSYLIYALGAIAAAVATALLYVF